MCSRTVKSLVKGIVESRVGEMRLLDEWYSYVNENLSRRYRLTRKQMANLLHNIGRADDFVFTKNISCNNISYKFDIGEA